MDVQRVRGVKVTNGRMALILLHGAWRGIGEHAKSCCSISSDSSETSYN